jgi:putative DNA primase/helicase
MPGLEGDDWNDRLIASGPERAGEEWEAALTAPDSEAGAISALEEREFMSLAFPQRELLLGPWLPRPGLVMLHAPRGEGKTWFSLAVAKAVADGRDLLGWPCPNSARVLYVDGELPGASLQARLEKFPDSPIGKLHILCRDTFHLRQQLMPDLGEAEGRRELDRIIEQCQPDVIIFDSISTLVRSGVENEADSWAPLQAWLLQHRWQGRTVILVHHENRTGKPRGTSKREDVLDTMIGLKKMAEEGAEDESTFQLTFTKSRDFYGKEAEPMLVRLSMKEGRVAWTHETVRDARKEKIAELLAGGWKQTDIAKELHLTKGRVNQIVQTMEHEEITAKFVPRGSRAVRRERV